MSKFLSAGVVALAGSIFIGIGHAPAIHAQTQITSEQTKSSSLAFDVASVKPHEFARGQFAFGTADLESPVRISGNRVTIQGLLAGLVMTAYKLRNFQVSGAPDWFNETGRHQLYDIEAKVPGSGTPTVADVRKMLQTLLSERFQLKFHRETKELPAYDLVVGKNPPKLKLSAPDVESKMASTAGSRMDYTNVSISELVLRIGPQFDRPLFDRTGLQGGYDFSLEYTPSVLSNSVQMSPEGEAALARLYPPDEAPPLPVALQQQLGLKLLSAKERVEILVIDHVERPSAN